MFQNFPLSLFFILIVIFWITKKFKFICGQICGSLPLCSLGFAYYEENITLTVLVYTLGICFGLAF